MNDKLIKQLESVGFKKKKYERGELMACEPVKGQKYPFLGFYFESETFEIFMADDELAVLDLFSPTFKEIIAAVKEHTGVNLQPKQTKTQRIAELESQIEELRAKQQGFEDLLKALNEKVEKSENVWTKELVAPLPHEPIIIGGRVKESEILPTPKVEIKPTFKVGDKVVLTCEKLFSFDSNICNAIEQQTPVRVVNVNKHDQCVCVVIGINEYYFKFNELEHAPKLKFGGWAEVIGSSCSHSFEIGQKVLIGALDSDGYYSCSTVNHWYYVKEADLKPL